MAAPPTRTPETAAAIAGPNRLLVLMDSAGAFGKVAAGERLCVTFTSSGRGDGGQGCQLRERAV